MTRRTALAAAARALRGAPADEALDEGSFGSAAGNEQVGRRESALGGLAGVLYRRARRSELEECARRMGRPANARIERRRHTWRHPHGPCGLRHGGGVNRRRGTLSWRDPSVREESKLDRDELAAAAIRAGGDHTIKFTDVILTELGIEPHPVYLAASDAITRL